MKLTTIPFLAIAILLVATTTSTAQKKTYITKKINQTPPVIDGRFDDAVWETVDWGGNFIQREPYENQAPSQKTKFKILYDDDHLYVAVKAFDTEIDKISKIMSRRDGFDGDWVEINIDSYFDHLTGFSFTVSASGVKGDEAITNDGSNWDDSWDPIWYVKTSIDREGWNAEIKIPLYELRFADKQEHVWGLQIQRRFFRKEERSVWQFIPQNASGWVSLFGELKGINNIKPKKVARITPYAVAKLEKSKKEQGNPFEKGSKSTLSGGLDGKIGVTNDLTLDFTINPDFGQVEADPSEVNLTAFETFFEEKRPFFIEGRNILSFQPSGGGNPFSRDNLFYSRRIGRKPHLSPDLDNSEYLDEPDNTSILGAFKLTGKTKNGWSIGILESITEKEKAEIHNTGIRRKEVVEPFANYFTTRLQKDVNQGNTIIGGMFTATNRNLDEKALKVLHKSAYTGGIDFEHNWKNKTYYIQLKALFSHVRGSKEAIRETQEAPARYFQRTDVSHVKLDTNRTSLTGHGGTVEFGKKGNGKFRFATWLTWRSPELELNDVGFLRKADEVFQVYWMQYRITEPFSVFRRLIVNFNQWSGWDFNATNLYSGSNINLNTQFKNHWFLYGGVGYNGAGLSNRLLRGGLAVKTPGGWNSWIGISSDSRKKLRFSFSTSNFAGENNHSKFNSYTAEVTFRPVNALTFSAEPFFEHGKRKLQYIDEVLFEADKRYILAELNQKTLGVSFRINYSITPDLSIQYYGQPFISSGKYSNFKRVTNPKADQFYDRFHLFSENQISLNSEDATYNMDEDLNGNVDYRFENPNFDFFQFRSNLVARWEYIPGSTLFLVWSQNRTGDDTTGNFSFRNGIRDLFDVYPENIFLIKLSYTLGL